MDFKEICIKYKWVLSVIGFFTLSIGLGFILFPMGIYGFVKNPKDNNKPKKAGFLEKLKTADQLAFVWGGKCPYCDVQLNNQFCPKCKKTVQELSIKYNNEIEDFMKMDEALITENTYFLGGNKNVSDPTNGDLGIFKDKIIFKSNKFKSFEVNLKNIIDVEMITDDGATTGSIGIDVFGANNNNIQLKKFKNYLKIRYNLNKRQKELIFKFIAFTPTGTVKKCNRVYAKINSLLD